MAPVFLSVPEGKVEWNKNVLATRDLLSLIYVLYDYVSIGSRHFFFKLKFSITFEGRNFKFKKFVPFNPF